MDFFPFANHELNSTKNNGTKDVVKVEFLTKIYIDLKSMLAPTVRYYPNKVQKFNLSYIIYLLFLSFAYKCLRIKKESMYFKLIKISRNVKFCETTYYSKYFYLFLYFEIYIVLSTAIRPITDYTKIL